MEQNEWKYKIGSGKLPVILMFLMSALFCGLTAWLYSTDNGTFLFGAILATIMLLVFILTIYRFLFYKVLIGKDRFYYQTGIGNGRYYAYTDIEKAWISSGTAQNGGEAEYCNIAPYGATVIRFQFFSSDEKAVKYLIRRVNAASEMRTSLKSTEKDEYLIDGKVFGKLKIGVGIAVSIMIVLINGYMIKEIGFHASLIPGYVMAIIICWMLFVDYLFFRVKIEKDRFYCRTNPFNGKWYQYSDITHCKEIKRVVRHQRVRGASHRRYFFYFQFTDVNGTTRKFQFSKEIFEHEIHVLQERIEHAHS